MRIVKLLVGVSPIVVFMVSLASCGGSPSSPSTGDSGGTPVSTTTITITSAGVSPAAITVPAGTRVLFINNDNRVHEMDSDPHPEHTDCPPINNVGFISPGQQKETGNLNTVRSCGFHDHGDPNNSRLRGRIVIQ
jgi:plastocyanin